MTVSYYPGCSLHSTGIEYDLSFKAVTRALGVEMVELDDWNCCGASSAHGSSEFLSLALPLRNLVNAEAQGLPVLVPCAACYNRLRVAHHETVTGTQEAQAANDELQRLIGRDYRGRSRVIHPLEFLTAPALVESIGASLKGGGLKGLKVCSYYGCLLQRPEEAVAFEDPDNPTSMDRLMDAAGAQAVDWSYKTDCCGAGLTMARQDVVSRLSTAVVEAAREAGAEAIVTACHLCHANLDTRQDPDGQRLPVYYFTELLGAAMGLDDVGKWVSKHLTEARRPLAMLDIL